jgi:hypothetical protein
MLGKLFWQGALQDGAVLGLVMAASHIFESFMMYGDMALGKVSLIVTIEMLAAAIFFVWYLYRSAKRRSMEVNPEQGFPYSVGLLYIFVISILCGVLVGFSQVIYVGAIGGYDIYIEGIISRYEDMAALMPVDDSMFDQFIDQLSASERPTVMQSVISSVDSYIIFGCIVGLIVAGIVRREPQKSNFGE